MKVLYLNVDPAGCFIYRVYNYVKALNKVEPQTAYYTNLHKSVNEVRPHVDKFDIIVMSRYTLADGIDFIKYCRDKGKIVLYDIDDNIFEIHPSNKDPYKTYDNVVKQNIVEMMKLSNRITVSTEVLAKVYGKFNKVEIFPNFIDIEMWENLRFKTENLKSRIGWAGGKSHFIDLTVIKNVIDSIINRNDLEVWIFGFNIFENVNHVPGVQINYYPQVMKLVNLDVGLAPLAEIEFNRGKSNIKFLEYTMCDAVTIATDLEPYRCIENNVDGILVKNDVRSWLKAIERVVKDKDFRNYLLENAKKKVYNEYSVEVMSKVCYNKLNRIFNEGG